MQLRSLATLDGSEIDVVLDRNTDVDEIHDDVDRILRRVQADGDDALREFGRRFDDVDVGALDITQSTEEAVAALDSDVRAAIETAIDRVRSFHERQLREDWTDTFNGVTLGRQFRPIQRIGAYVPGGSAAYPSTAIMTVVPATVAGVDEVVVVTPPADEVEPVTLATLHLAGADEVYNVGGAQAIGALAYGTESISAVDKIVGPGNRWVTAAKAEVRSDVAIDMIAGPTEVLVIADKTSNARLVAAELISQAEHDPHSSAVAVTPDESIGNEIIKEINQQVSAHNRADIIREAFANDSSGVFLTESMTDATEFAEAYAVEHLVVMTENNEPVNHIDSAGSVFIGEYSPVAAGDYASGTNHVLPTAQSARTTGGLSVDSFVRSRTIQHLDREGLEMIADTIVTLAELEGLEAHAESVRTRLE